MNAPINLPWPDRDNEGYLKVPADRSPDLALQLADEAELPLSTAHWEVIRLIRSLYGAHEAKRRPYQLFPGGYGQQACKIAGMRKPLKLMLDV